MKTEIRVNLDAGTFELWHNGEMVGEVVGSEGSGVKVVSKHPMLSQWHANETGTKWVEIRIGSGSTSLPFPEKPPNVVAQTSHPSGQ